MRLFCCSSSVVIYKYRHFVTDKVQKVNRWLIPGHGGENPAEFLASGHELKNRSGQTS